jgi:hypothetical protein
VLAELDATLTSNSNGTTQPDRCDQAEVPVGEASEQLGLF